MKKKIGIFLSSSDLLNEKLKESVDLCVKLCKENKYDIVYGGANRGLMGILADKALARGVAVYGVIPEFLKDKEVAHQSLTEIIFVKTMSERKEKMAEMSDAFLSLPGGMGTVDELFEMLTWSQLNIHKKVSGLYNADGLYDGIIQYLERAISEKLISENIYHFFKVDSNLDALFSFIGERL